MDRRGVERRECARSLSAGTLRCLPFSLARAKLRLQGISRSPAVVIAYLIRNLGMSFDAALAKCKQTRACVKPNSGFVKCLQEWERVQVKIRQQQSQQSQQRPAAMSRRFTTQ